jgi:hypothetical protein
MKKTILKLTNISFPLFALSKKPYKVEYSSDKIYCYTTPESHRATLDNKNLPGDYFSRLLQMDNRITFDYTCKNIQDIIYAKVAWGIDSAGNIHDLSTQTAVTWESRKIRRINKNLIWLHKISYPFKINTNEEIVASTDMYATIIYVNNEWYIKEFTLDKITENRKMTV